MYVHLCLLAINTDSLTPDHLIQTVDENQSGYSNRFIGCTDLELTSFHAEAAVSNRVKLRHPAHCAASPEGQQSGSCRSDTATHAKHARTERAQCETMGRHASLSPGSAPALTDTSFCGPATHGRLAELFSETNALATLDDDGSCTSATEIDLEEQAVRYQAADSKLATASVPAQDVVVYVGDMRVHAVYEFTRLLSAEPGVKALVEQAHQSQVGTCLANLGVSV